MSNYFRGHNYRCPPVKLVLVNYNRIAGNFRERKLSQIGEKYNFRGENFHRLLTFAAPKDARLRRILQRKLSQIATKTRNSRKFSSSKVSHYTVSSTYHKILCSYKVVDCMHTCYDTLMSK